MRKSWIIARRDLASFFDGPMAYILLVLLLGAWGFFTWWYGAWHPDVFVQGQADLTAFFQTAYWTLFLFIPALTMRTLAEERRTGTLDLLLTKAVTDWQVVFGKFIAALLLIVIALVFTLPYYAAIAWIGPVDHGAVWCGYLGLFCMSAGYVAMGILASSMARNQIEAFLLGMIMILMFHVVFMSVPGNFVGAFAAAMQSLSTAEHFDSMSRGVVDSRDLVYFLSIVVLGLVLAEINLAKRLFNKR
jgi:ABC-2 type transport system permease protein